MGPQTGAQGKGREERWGSMVYSTDPNSTEAQGPRPLRHLSVGTHASVPHTCTQRILSPFVLQTLHWPGREGREQCPSGADGGTDKEAPPLNVLKGEGT